MKRLEELSNGEIWRRVVGWCTLTHCLQEQSPKNYKKKIVKTEKLILSRYVDVLMNYVSKDQFTQFK
jgi:hypothetical protein